MKIKRKNNITLIEIMIVVAIIAGLSSVIYYNARGALQKGKISQTELAIKKLEDILLYAIETYEEDITEDNIQEKAGDLLIHSGLVKDPQKSLKDAWGEEFIITMVKKHGARRLKIKSDMLTKLKKQNKKNNESS